MSMERYDLLEQVEFVWDTHVMSWDAKYAELLKYYRCHGNCNVPANYKYNPSLAVWIKCQRRQYKLFWAREKQTQGHMKQTSSLTKEKIARMDAIGFVWTPRGDN